MLKLAAATGALVPGISPQGKLPPIKPGDEDKIAKRLGQTSGSNVNGKRWLLHKDSILCYTNWQYTQTYTNNKYTNYYKKDLNTISKYVTKI